MRAETVYGTIGLKVWIYKWDIYKKNKKLDS
jgi:ribosomal protein S3